jgi:tetratricopeptide (TPR) repeat protein
LYYFQEKDYNKALDAANEAVKAGANDLEMLNLIAKSQYLLGKYKEAAEATMQEVVGKQDKPDEDSLKLLWQFDLKANDKRRGGQGRGEAGGLLPQARILGQRAGLAGQCRYQGCAPAAERLSAHERRRRAQARHRLC